MDDLQVQYAVPNGKRPDIKKISPHVDKTLYKQIEKCLDADLRQRPTSQG